MNPLERLQAEFMILARRLNTLETRIECGLLPARLAQLAADYQILDGICRLRRLSPNVPRQRPMIARELKRRGFSVPRIAKTMSLSEERVRKHLKRASEPGSGFLGRRKEQP